MPRMLSNIEWATFQQDVDIPSLDLPPWGGIVTWGGMDVLVFVKATGEVGLTDVSDLSAQWKQQFPATYEPAYDVFVYSLPENVVASAAQAAAAAGAILQATATQIGKTAGAALAPVASSLSVPLIVIGLVALLVILREARI